MSSSSFTYLFILSQKALFTTATVYPRPTWDILFNAFSTVENKVCVGDLKDGGCDSCTSCFYMDLYTAADGKTFYEAQVRIRKS